MADIIDLHAPWRQKARTSKKTGKTKRGNFRVDYEAEPLLVNTDAREVGALLAATLGQCIQREIEDISVQAAPATIERRERYRRDGSSKSYRKRYSGGRTGETPPTDTRLFNASGRLKKVTVRPRRRSSGEAVFTVNFPANRLNPNNWGGGASSFRNMVQRLRQHAPILAGKIQGESERTFQSAQRDVARMMVSNNKAKMAQLRRAQLQLIKQITGLLF